MEAREILAHGLVLDDVDVAEGRDDALADGVIPARHVPDRRDSEPARADEERNRGVRLDVREHERAALGAHAPVELVRDVAARAEVPPLHRALDRAPVRQGAVAVRVEHPVRMPRLHALPVEPVSAVQAHREWVVAELAVEQPIDSPDDAFARADVERDEVGAVQHAPVNARRPVRALVAVGEDDD